MVSNFFTPLLFPFNFYGPFVLQGLCLVTIIMSCLLTCLTKNHALIGHGHLIDCSVGFRSLRCFRSCNSLVLEVLHRVLHPPELRVQAASLPKDTIQLSPEAVDVLLEQRLQVLPHGLGALFLQQGPLGVQDLVLLLQESHLQGDKMVICELTSPQADLVVPVVLGCSRACTEADSSAPLIL